LSQRHEAEKYAGLDYRVDATGQRKLFAHIDVSGLTDDQIAMVREYAISMQPQETKQ